MDVRIRLHELLKSSGKTIYAVAKASDGRVSTSALYRLKKEQGRARYFDATMLEALCDVFGVGPGDLLERDTPAKRKR
jgi:DNA-binding Xre family transcriptional regulator